MTASAFTRGIRENKSQIAHQLIQVMLVGFAIGMTRTVVPALTVSRRSNEGDRFACSSPSLVLDAMAELRPAADEGVVDLDHTRQSTGKALPIIHHLADRMAKLPRGLLVHAQNA